jgi:opine dehydrogenase
MAKLAVLGAGNGGQALSGHLALLGHDVGLYEHPDFADKLSPISKAGGITLTGTIEGFGKLRCATADANEAIQGTEVLFLVVPSFGQMPILQEILPFLRKGMRILFIPGNFGTLEAAKLLRDCGVDIGLSETDTLPYACRATAPGEVNIWGTKKAISFASFPGKYTASDLSCIQSVFPFRLNPLSNVLEAGLMNMNMVIHCAGVLLNIGRIEATQGNFRFYTDGVTPSVGKLQELIDSERLAVGQALGLALTDAKEWVRKAYAVQGESLSDLLSKNPAYGNHGPDAPKSITHRYVTEDAPNLLVPLLELAKACNLQAPITSSVLSILSALVNEDFTGKGRNLTRLGLDGKSQDQIRSFVMNGNMSLS